MGALESHSGMAVLGQGKGQSLTFLPGAVWPWLS